MADTKIEWVDTADTMEYRISQLESSLEELINFAEYHICDGCDYNDKCDHKPSLGTSNYYCSILRAKYYRNKK